MDMQRIGTQQAAQVLGCSQGHIRKLVQLGYLTPDRLSPHVLLFDRAQLDAYARDRRRPGRPPVGDGLEAVEIVR